MKIGHYTISWEKCKVHLVTLAIVLLVDVLGVFGNVAFKLSADSLHNYPYFMSLISLSVYIVCFGSIFCVQHFVFHSIEEAVFRFPLRKFFYLSIILAAAHVLLYVATPHVSGPTSNLLQQAVLVIQFIFAIIFFRRRYSAWHFAAVFVVAAGIVVFFLPAFFHADDTSGDAGVSAFFWELMVLAWCVLWALNNTAFEKILTEQCSSTAWLNIWVSLFCIPVDALFALVILLISKQSFASEIINGGKCLFLGHTGIESDFTCKDALWEWVLYSMLSMTTSLLNLTLIKRMGAASLGLFSAVCVPLTNIAFSSKFLIGEQAVPIDNFTIISTVIITLGMIAYGAAEFYADKKKSTNGDFLCLELNDIVKEKSFMPDGADVDDAKSAKALERKPLTANAEVPEETTERTYVVSIPAKEDAYTEAV